MPNSNSSDTSTDGSSLDTPLTALVENSPTAMTRSDVRCPEHIRGKGGSSHHSGYIPTKKTTLMGKNESGEVNLSSLRKSIDPPGRGASESSSSDGESPPPSLDLDPVEATIVYQAEPILVTSIALSQKPVTPAVVRTDNASQIQIRSTDYAVRDSNQLTRNHTCEVDEEDVEDDQSCATDQAVDPRDKVRDSNQAKQADEENARSDEEQSVDSAGSQLQLPWWKLHKKLVYTVGIIGVSVSLIAVIASSLTSNSIVPDDTKLPPPVEPIPIVPTIGNYVPPNKACDEVEVKINFGHYSGEISWDIKQVRTSGDDLVVSTYDAKDGEVEHIETMCLEEGQYRFTIYDSAGDGLCCDSHGGEGYYVVALNGAVILQGAEFESIETAVFEVIEPTCDQAEVDVTIFFDDDPDETSWSIARVSAFGDDVVMATFDAMEREVKMRAEHTESLCLEEGLYRFTIHDKARDGLCCGHGHGQDGNYTVMSHGSVLAHGGDFVGSNETSTFNVVDPNCNRVNVNVVFDDYPELTSWDIRRFSTLGHEIVEMEYDAGNGEIEHTESICLGEGQYKFTIYDDDGYGMCCESGEKAGHYNVTLNGVVIGEGGEFGSNEAIAFNITGPPPRQSLG